MSLINKMLQDLEERKSGGETLGDWQGQVRAAPASGSRRIHWTAILAASGLLAVLAGAGAWWMSNKPTSNPDPVAAQPLVKAPPMNLKLDHFPSLPAGLGVEASLSNSTNAETKDGDSLTRSVQPAGVSGPALQEQTPGAKPSGLANESVASKTPTVNTSLHGDTSRALAIAESKVVQAPLAAASAPAQSRPAVKETERIAESPENADEVGAANPVRLSKQVKDFTPQQRAENEYRRAHVLIEQGKSKEAMSALESALQIDTRHATARQTLAALLIDSKLPDEAIQKLNDGLNADRAQPGLAMMQARLQVDRQDVRSAIETLQLSLPYAVERADYRAFLAALLQREARHKEAIEHYLAALKKNPGNGLWWMGAGISLQAENRIAESRDAFGRARLSGNLSPDLLAFVEQKLVQLR